MCTADGEVVGGRVSCAIYGGGREAQGSGYGVAATRSRRSHRDHFLLQPPREPDRYQDRYYHMIDHFGDALPHPSLQGAGRELGE
jgi:hypothetical protein